MSTAAPNAVCRRTLLFALLAATAGITEAQASARADALVRKFSGFTAEERSRIARDLDGSTIALTEFTANSSWAFGATALAVPGDQSRRVMNYGSWSLRVLALPEKKLDACLKLHARSLAKFDVEVETFNHHAAEQLKLLAV